MQCEWWKASSKPVYKNIAVEFDLIFISFFFFLEEVKIHRFWHKTRVFFSLFYLCYFACFYCSRTRTKRSNFVAKHRTAVNSISINWIRRDNLVLQSICRGPKNVQIEVKERRVNKKVNEYFCRSIDAIRERERGKPENTENVVDNKYDFVAVSTSIAGHCTSDKSHRAHGEFHDISHFCFVSFSSCQLQMKCNCQEYVTMRQHQRQSHIVYIE